MLSPLVTWDHSKTWNLPQSCDFLSGGHGQLSQSSFTLVMEDNGKDRYLLEQKTRGLNLFPVAGYLVLAWKCLAKYFGQLHNTMPVLLQNVHIHRPTVLPDKGTTQLHVLYYILFVTAF